MSSGSCLTSKLYDKIIKMLSKSHETLPLTTTILMAVEKGAGTQQSPIGQRKLSFSKVLTGSAR
jgi:hypothetical protein